MYSRRIIPVFITAISVCIFFTAIGKERPGLRKSNSTKATTIQFTALMNGNNATSWVRSDGSFPTLISQSWNGEFPKGSGVGTVYSEGIVFGGIVSDGLYPQSLRVNGDTYFIGMQPGAIHSDGSVDDATTSFSRTFGVRPDLPPSISGNPSQWPDLVADAASVLQKSQSSVTSADVAQIAAQYFADWNEWPAAKGAPWYVDSIQIVRNDGSFDYTNPHHIPGIPRAAKTVWFVCNDQNAAASAIFAGSPPIGIEEQMTLWCFATSKQLNNTVFKQVKLIYKGNPGAPANARIDSMYIVLWSDPDIGNSGDDFAGCDSLLNLGYAYDSQTTDAKYAAAGLPAPAVGYQFIQGASRYTGNPADSAVINFRWRKGYKYWFGQPLNSFCYFGSGSAVAHPDNGVYAGTQQWFNLMRGDLPRPQYPAGIPFVGQGGYARTHGISTSYVLAGDPTTGQGWIDGYDIPAGDRQLINVHGPMTLNLHDTAEVVVAFINAMGTDNLSSVRVLKSSSAFAKAAFDQMLYGRKAPDISFTSSFGAQTTVSFRANASGMSVSGITMNLRTSAGVLAGTTTLLDDGLHNDGAANDHIFGGSTQISQQQSSLSADETVTYANGASAIWSNVISGITTAGPVAVSSPVIASDNLNSDGIPNPGENIRITISLTNNSALNLQGLSVTNQISLQRITFGSLGSNSSAVLHYNPNSRATYFEFTIPQNYVDSHYSVPFAISDSLYNLWQDTLRFAVEKLPLRPYLSPVVHTQGQASGTFTIIVVDSSALKNHAYEIDGLDSIDAAGHHGITLKDLATNSIVLNAHGLPDSLGHTMPVTDGFKILKGTTLDSGAAVGMTSWSVPMGIRQFSPVGGFTGLGLEGFSNVNDPIAYDQQMGTIGMAGHFAFGGIGTTLTAQSQYHTVLLRLAAVDQSSLWDPKAIPADSNYSLGYRYLRMSSQPPADSSFALWIIHAGAGYPYQDFNYSVPFSAWDMETNPPTRLAVGMFENNVVGGLVDGRYWPPTAIDNTIAREFAFIFAAPYSTTSNPTFQVNLSGNSLLPLMWVMTCDRRQAVSWSGTDQFVITGGHTPGNGDRWTFNPTVMGISGNSGIPREFALLQNYPNPFNPSTTIRYRLPLTSRVIVRIYNLLGQEIRMLENGIEHAGEQALVWDSKNNNGQSVSSGVYFYRIQASAISGTRQSFTEIRKMLLLK